MAENFDNAMERLFQSYQREENIKLREKAKRNKAQRQQQIKATDDGSQSSSLKSRDEDVTDQSLEKALSNGLKRFKAGDGYRTAATALEGVCLLIRILNDVKDHPDRFRNMRKHIWDDIKKQLIFRASKAFLMQNIENQDALEAVIRKLKTEIEEKTKEGETIYTSRDLRSMMTALNTLEERLESSLEGRVQFVNSKVINTLIELKDAHPHVLRGSILSLRRIPEGLIQREIADRTLCVGNLPPGVRREEISSYFNRYGGAFKVEHVELPFARYNSVQHMLHTRCKQLLEILMSSEREDDKTVHEIVKMQKLLEDQELDRFFLEKLQAEAMLRASALFDAEQDPKESKTVAIDNFNKNTKGSTQKSRHGFDEESELLGQCHVCGRPICVDFCTSQFRYRLMKISFVILTIVLILFPFIMFSVSTYVAQQYVNAPSLSSRELMERFASTLLYLNAVQLLCILILCLIGIRIGKFHRHEIIKCSTLFDILLLSCLIGTGIFATQYEDERTHYLYVLLSCGQSGFSVILVSFRLVPIAWSWINKCCERTRRAKTNSKNRYCRALDCLFRPFRAKCPSLSFATCIRTFRCVSCIIPSRICRLSGISSCDCISRYGMCCDLVDVEYADDHEGLIEMKIDLENQCNVLLETMKTEDLTVKDPAFHHYAARMRWKIKRLKRKIQHRLEKSERKKYEYKKMKHHNNCFACGVRFDQWIVEKNYCSACGYTFCAACTANVRTLDDLGLKHSNVCDQCARDVDKQDFESTASSPLLTKRK